MMQMIFWAAPLLVFVVALALEIGLGLPLTADELAPVEMFQAVLLGLGVIAAIRAYRCSRAEHSPLALWFVLAIAGCTYVLLEEVSYGQHLFGWATPEGWNALNDQGETNLHNTSAWFDQKPRILLEVGVLTATLAATFCAFRSRPLLPRLGSVMPGSAVIAPGWIAVAAFILDEVLLNTLGLDFGIARPSELEELYLYWTVLAYLAERYPQARHLPAARGQAGLR